MKLWHKITVGIIGTGVALGANTVPVEMKYVKSEQYPVAEEASFFENSIKLGEVNIPHYPDSDGNGLITIAYFTDSKGQRVYQQISEQTLEEMRLATGSLPNGKGGVASNPTKTELVSLGSLIVPIAHAAVARDVAASGTGAGTTLTYAHTVTGSNTSMVVYIFDQASNGSVTSVTYAGEALTQSQNIICPTGGTNRRIYAYGAFGANTGANNIQVDRTTTSGGVVNVASISYTGTSQTTIPDASTNNTATAQTSITTTLTTTQSGSGVSGAGVPDTVILTAGTATTRIGVEGDMSYGETTTFPSGAAGNYSMQWTDAVPTSQNYCAVSYAVRSDTVASTFNPYYFMDY